MDKMYTEMQNYVSELRVRIKKLEELRKAAPGTYLQIKRKNSHIYFFERTAGPKRKQKYISLKNITRIQQLVNKKYAEEILPKLHSNLYAAELFLRIHSSFSEEDLGERFLPELLNYSGNSYIPKSKIMENWLNEPYERNPFYPEALIHDTLRGEMVRSKSEVIIANALFRNSLCYKTECPLKLRHGNVYPDFTIIHPKTLKIFYWEHFGMMDNPEYANDACQKIKEYAESGICQGENMICTFESTGTPLSSTLVQNLINIFFK